MVAAAELALPMDAVEIVAFLRRLRVDLGDEIRAQRSIASSFENRRIPFLKEVPLSSADRIDFLVGEPGKPGIGVEVKLKKGWGKMEIYRQLERYARSERVASIVLVTNNAMGLPESIEGKPAYYVSLGQAWL